MSYVVLQILILPAETFPSLESLLSTMHTATRGPGRRKQHYSQATFNMHLEAVTTDRNIAMAHSAAHRSSLKQDRSVTLQGDY